MPEAIDLHASFVQYSLYFCDLQHTVSCTARMIRLRVIWAMSVSFIVSSNLGKNENLKSAFGRAYTHGSLWRMATSLKQPVALRHAHQPLSVQGVSLTIW